MYSVSLLLKLIPRAEPLSWRDFLAAFEDGSPLEPFEKATLQLQLETLATIDLITITRTNRAEAKLQPTDALQLTELGAERAREALKGEGYVHAGTSTAKTTRT